MEPLKIPLCVECATINDVSVWEWAGSAYDEGAEAAEWFSTFLGCPTRLVRFNEGANLCFLQAFPFTWNILLDEVSALLMENFDVTISFNRLRN